MQPKQTALGIDIGGTRTRLGVVQRDRTLLAWTDAPTPPAGDPVSLAALLRRLREETQVQAAATSSAIGVGVPGLWDRQTGIMQRALNLPKLEGLNIVELFAGALGAPVLVDSDANAATWAQWHMLEPRPQRLVHLSIGTGVGGGVILDGRLLRPTRGGAGHLGHLCVDPAPDAPVCRCGARGCLEAVVRSSSTLESLAHRLAVALHQLMVLFAPDVITLGGGVIDHQPDLVASARAAFAQTPSNLTPPALRIERAALPADRAGVIGAALLALYPG